MARPIKVNLDFFPFDVKFFADEKLDDVQNEYGPLGEAIYLRLLCFIYGDKGYYYEFETLDKVANRIIRSIGNRWVRNKEYVIKVISYLAECNLFSKELMRNNILTSVGIQRRYVYVMGKILKRQVRIKKYNLLEKTVFDNGLEIVPENEVNSEETGVNSEETTGLFGENDTKSKVNKNNARAKTAIERFEFFWCCYPLDKNRYLAEQAYIGVIMDGIYTEDDLVDAAKNYAEYCKITGTDKIYHADNFLKKCVFEDYLPGKYKKPTQQKKNSFNDFPQREYDFDELERELLANPGGD